MELNELNLHDSNIIKINRTENKIEFLVDLCNWKQTWYQEGEDELREINISFQDIADFIWDADISIEEVDYYTIIDFSISDNSVKIVASDDTVVVCEFNYSKYEVELL